MSEDEMRDVVEMKGYTRGGRGRAQTILFIKSTSIIV